MGAEEPYGPQYPLGELPLLVDERTRRSVAFLCHQNARGQRYPIGTVLFVGVQYASTELVGLALHHHEQLYAVTAKHVLTGAATFWVRLRTEAGKTVDVPTRATDWKRHIEADVAVLPWNTPNKYHLNISADHEFADDEWLKLKDIDVGTRLFFVGLFSTAEGLPEKKRWSPSQPVARFGTLALGLGEKVPLQEGSKTVWRDAYLAEAHSWGGMSGAPCYAYLQEGHDRSYGHGSVFEGQRWHLAGFGRLLGLVSGHYPVTEKIALSGSQSSKAATAAINSGIAQTFKKQREARARDEAKHVEGAAVLDVVPDEPPTRDDFIRDLRRIRKQPTKPEA